jgi:hypothetical protein
MEQFCVVRNNLCLEPSQLLSAKLNFSEFLQFTFVVWNRSSSSVEILVYLELFRLLSCNLHSSAPQVQFGLSTRPRLRNSLRSW